MTGTVRMFVLVSHRSYFSEAQFLLSLLLNPSDCPNIDEGFIYWNQEFVDFENRYWSHDFGVTYQPGRRENFSFELKRTLFIGLNIVGGRVESSSEWTTRLTEEVEWTKGLIREYDGRHSGSVGRVVIFGHADPKAKHDQFFIPLQDFIANELQNTVPILYLNGDGHKFASEPNFYGQPSFYRLMVRGLAKEPPMKVMVHATGDPAQPLDAFTYDRML
jgi:hypothetical protein